MKHKGFTLVELLAVIVILAIILLISVPTVLAIIESSKKGAAVDTCHAIEETASNYFALALTHDKTISEILFECNGSVCTNGPDVLELKGQIPSSGKFKITDTGKFEITEPLIVGNYECVEENNSFKCTKQ